MIGRGWLFAGACRAVVVVAAVALVITAIIVAAVVVSDHPRSMGPAAAPTAPAENIGDVDIDTSAVLIATGVLESNDTGGSVTVNVATPPPPPPVYWDSQDERLCVRHKNGGWLWISMYGDTSSVSWQENNGCTGGR